MAIFFPILVLLAAVPIYIVRLYNKLVRCRFLVREAFSGIDVQLKRRHDLIPKLVDTVSGYAQYEKPLLEKVTALRAQITDNQGAVDKMKVESELSGCLKSIFALVEAYPDLKANDSFLTLQNTISQIEDDLQMARRYYNGTVRDYNVLVEQFPSNLVAGAWNFLPDKFFEVEYATQRQSPDVRFM